MQLNHSGWKVVACRILRWVLAVVATLAALTPASAAQAARCGKSAPLNIRIEKFDTRGLRPIEVLLRLGHQHGVCFGVEYVSRKTLLTSRAKELGGGTLEDVLAVLFPPSKGYVFQARGGVVEIQNRKLPSAPDRNLFRARIPVFKTTRRASLQDNSNALNIQLFYTLHPEAKGVAGSYRPGDSSNETGPFDEHGRTVAGLLDLLVANSSKGGLWLAKVPPDRLGSLPSSGIWAVLDYAPDPRAYRPLLEAFAADFRE